MALLAPERVTRWRPGIPGGRPRRTAVLSLPAGATPSTHEVVWTPAGNPYGGYSINPALGDNASNAATAINDAISSAAAAARADGFQRIVLLAGGVGWGTGAYYCPGLLNFNTNSSVTLRGEGPGTRNATGLATKLRFERSTTSGVWVGSSYGNTRATTAYDVVGTALKGSETITIAGNQVASFPAGTSICIDMADDPAEVYTVGTSPTLDNNWVRGPGPNVDGRCGPNSATYRHKGQMCRVIATPTLVGGNTVLRIFDAATDDGAPLHSTYRPVTIGGTTHLPQVFWWRYTAERDGVEHLYVTGTNGGAIRLWNTAFCWLYHVEIDGSDQGSTYQDDTYGGTYGTITGTGYGGDIGVDINFSYRNLVAGVYDHHDSSGGNQASGSYGIVYYGHTADCEIVNNISRYRCKPFMGRSTGGGNVIAYNYADDAKTGAFASVWRYFQETTIDPCHGVYAHMDLYEGNWAPHMEADATWGMSGYLTFFRNRCTGVHRRNRGYPETGNQGAMVVADLGCVNLNAVGNVLGYYNEEGGATPNGGAFNYYESNNGGTRAVWVIGRQFHPAAGGGGSSTDYDPTPYAAVDTRNTLATVPRPGASLVRRANYDFVRHALDEDAVAAGDALPDSMFLGGRPSYFPSSYAWPPINAYAATEAARAGSVPARDRFEAFTPNALVETDAPIQHAVASVAGGTVLARRTIAANADGAVQGMAFSVAQPADGASETLPFPCVGKASAGATVRVFNEDTGSQIGSAQANQSEDWSALIERA